MKAWKKNKKIVKEKNNRINVLMAIIFILGMAIIGKLYKLQVIDHKHYIALAMKQQQASGKLEAVRGRIFLADDRNGEERNVFPLATNKQFATVFAKPSIISDPEKVASGLYEIFGQKIAEKEAERKISEDKEFASSSEAVKNIKRELEIKAQQEKIMSDYILALSKKNDPYEPIAKNVDEDVLKILKEKKLEGIDYMMESGRYYPEKNVGAHMLGFVGYVGNEKEGRYGLEGFFNKELSGKSGSVIADRSAAGDLIIKDENDYEKAENGNDLLLTINRSIQFEACQKLKESVMKHGADGGSVVVIEPKSGSIIAMCSWPDYDPNDYKNIKSVNIYNNPIIFNTFEPGSTFKSITMAAALDQGKVTPNTTYNDKGTIMIEGWPKPIKNSDFSSFGGHGVTDMNTVLEKSLNTGAIFAMEQIGPQVFADYVKKFGFAEKTGIELETEALGNIRNLTGKKVRPINAATASFGQGLTVNSLQMANSYAVIANGGILMKPFLVKEIINPDGSKITTQPKQVRRVISERTASLLTGMMVNAVENGHASRAKVPGYYVAGKTGTAQVASDSAKGYAQGKTIQTFIGYSPANDPKFVMLTRLDDPKDSKFAESSAVPLFGDIAKFILNYYQVPQERSVDKNK